MLKVMIVDDEFLVRVGIKSSINWNANGFDIVAEADNGLDALNILKKEPVDILLLDIEMPQMDGLELLEKMHEQNINPKVIILSSHNDFEYARKAMKLGCVDYILKLSVEPSQLLELLHSVSSTINQEEKTKKLDNKLDDKIDDKKEINLFLQNIENKQSCREQLLKSVFKRTTNSKLIVLYISVDEEKNTENDIKNYGTKLYNNSLVNIIHGAINDFSTGDCFQHSNGDIMGVINIKSYNEARLLEIGKNIQNSLRSYLEVTCSIGFGVEGEGYNDILNSYLTARKSCGKRFFSEGGIVEIWKETPTTSPITFTIKTEDRLKLAVEFGNQEKALDLVEGYFDNIMNCHEKIEKSNVVNDMNSMLHIFEHELKFYHMKIEDIDGYDKNSDIKKLNDITYISQMEDRVKKFIGVYFEQLYMLREQVVHNDISKVIDYIQQNYNKDLSVAFMAEKFNMSSSYFGTMFKRMYKESFSSYLTKYRIEKSKDLLRTTQKTVSEIADSVGYENVYYFSNVFKKVTSKSPMTYKKEIIEGVLNESKN